MRLSHALVQVLNSLGESCHAGDMECHHHPSSASQSVQDRG